MLLVNSRVVDTITPSMIHVKKILDSDWLRAVQFKCKTSTKRVTLVQKSVNYSLLPSGKWRLGAQGLQPQSHPKGEEP